MGSTSSLDLMTKRFEFGVPRLVLQSAVLRREKLRVWRLLLTLLMGRTFFHVEAM